MASEPQLKAFQDTLESILKIDKELLIRRSVWGEINFETIRQHLDLVFNLAATYATLKLTPLPDEMLSSIRQSFTNVANQIGDLNRFSIQQSNFVSVRNEIISNIQARSQELFRVAGPWVTYIAYQEGDFRKLLESIISNAEKATEAKKLAEQQTNELKNIIEKTREVAAGEVSAVFSNDFAEESKNLTRSSTLWLSATAVLALVTLTAASLMWCYSEPNLDNGQLLQRMSTKLVILAVLLTSTIWCGRNYKALKHLSTVNKHRALSIRTLQAFVAAASDSQTKNAVLLEATRAIFGNVPTGYIEGASSDSDLKIIEIARSILPKTPS